MTTKHGEETETPVAGEEPHSAQVTTQVVASGIALTNAPPAEIADEQALIEEARRRQRRRHWWIGGVILAIALIGTGFGLGLSFGTGSPTTSHHYRTSNSSAPPAASTSAVTLNRPEALAVAFDGGLLIANQGTNQVIRRTPNGTLAVVAGTGTAGYRGDGGPALKAELNDPGGMVVAPNGTIYVADTGNNRIRAISPSGTITTVAGNGQLGSRGTGEPALDTEVAHPVALALTSQNQLYIVDDTGIQLVSSNGDLNTVMTAGSSTLSINGTPTAFFPTAIAMDSAGDLFIADFSPKLLVELAPTGSVVNSWPIYVTRAGLAEASNGSILVGDYGGFSVDRIANGQLTSLATFSLNSLTGLRGTFRPSGIAVSSSGQIYADTNGVNGGTNQAVVAAIGPSGDICLLPTATGGGR